MSKLSRSLVLLLTASLLLISGVLTGCSVETNHSFEIAPVGSMPAEVQSAPVTVQQAYQFVSANPDVAIRIPCYCGCKSLGHRSNFSCYISSLDADGTITYDYHALGCSICVDITQDTMRMLKQGKTVPEIKAYVDQTYAKYDPSNMPEGN